MIPTDTNFEYIIYIRHCTYYHSSVLFQFDQNCFLFLPSVFYALYLCITIPCLIINIKLCLCPFTPTP